MLKLLIEKIRELLQPHSKNVVVYLWEFSKEEITKEEQKTYVEWKDVLAVELKKIKNQMLSLHQLTRSIKDKDDLLRNQWALNELYKIFNRLNILINPELYTIKEENTQK